MNAHTRVFACHLFPCRRVDGECECGWECRVIAARCRPQSVDEATERVVNRQDVLFTRLVTHQQLPHKRGQKQIQRQLKEREGTTARTHRHRQCIVTAGWRCNKHVKGIPHYITLLQYTSTHEGTSYTTRNPLWYTQHNCTHTHPHRRSGGT